MIVQTVFTYTIPAAGGETIPPAAPIRCGCNNLLLLVKDFSILQTNLHGIIEVVIRDVTVSKTPVPFVSADSGSTILVWKYDYTFEYNTDDLTDPDYRLRKCDVEFNCCKGCAQEYTDRQLQGYVKSVGGACVNNADPQNPVVNPQTITGNIVTPIGACGFLVNQTLTRLEQSGTSILYTDENGNVSNIGVCDIVQACIDLAAFDFCSTPAAAAAFAACIPGGTFITAVGCGLNVTAGLLNLVYSGTWGGPGLAFPCDDNLGMPVYCDSAGGIRTAPEHFTSAPDEVTVTSSPAALVAIGDSRIIQADINITNPSTCRSMGFRVGGLSRAYGFAEVGDVTISFDNAINEGGGFVTNIMRKEVVLSGGTSINDFQSFWERQNVLAPGASVTVGCRTTITKTGGAGTYTFDGNLSATVTFFGSTSQ